MPDFGLPALLALLIFVPLLTGVLAWGIRQRRLAASRFAGSGLSQLLLGAPSRLRRRVKAGLLIASVALLALAGARPQFGQQHIILPRAGSDVVIAMDVSFSMGTQDVQPRRLDVSKQAAGAILSHLRGDRVGLVVFAGSAVSRFPLTTDLESARRVVDSVTIQDSGVKGGTDIAAAIATARDTLKSETTHSKVIVVITDGEDLAGNDLKAASDAGNSDVLIDTIGVGTQAGGTVIAVNPVSGKSTPVIDPDTGKQAISHRDDANLRQLAAAGHGTAYDGNTIDFAFDLSGAIDRLKPTLFRSGLASIPVEYFQVPLALALALLLLDTLLTENPVRRRARLSQRRAQSTERRSLRPATGDAGD